MCRKKLFTISSLFLSVFLLIFLLNVLPFQPLYGDDSDFIKEYKSAELYLQKGIKSFHKGNMKDAEKQFLKSLDKFPQYAEAHFFLSQISYQKGELSNALIRIEEAKRDSEVMAKILLNAEREAESQKKAKRLELGRQMGNLMTEWELQDSTCVLTAAVNATRSEINALEGQEVISVATSSAIPVNYFYLHGNILFRMKDYDNARKQYLAAIQTNPKHGESYNNLANLYYMSRRYEEALDCLSQSISFGVKINENLKEAIFAALGTPNADIMGREFAGGVKRFSLNVGEENTPFFMNAYLVFNPETKDAVLIDPGMNDKRIDTFIESRNLNLLAILNTHGHQDHIGANSYFAKKYDVEIYSHAADKNLYEKNDRSQIPNQFFTVENSLTFQKLTVKVIHTPGHSQGSCSFLINGALYKALAFEILKRTLLDHEKVKGLEHYSSDSDPYDVKISLSSQQDIESFQKTYGTSVLGLKLYLTVSQQ